MSDKKKKAQGLIILLLTALVLAALFRVIPLSDVIGLLQRIPAGLWAAAVLLAMSVPLMVAWRWQMILEGLGFKVPFLRALVVVLGVWPLSTISPAKSGDLLRAAGLREYIAPSVCAGSVVAERIADFFVLTLFALAGAAVQGRRDIFFAAAAGAGILSCMVGLSHLPQWSQSRPLVQNLLKAVRLFVASPGLTVRVLIWTALKWFAALVLTSVLFRGVGASVPFSLVATAFPPAIFIGLLPVTIAGMGLREGAMLVFFSSAAEPPQILAVGLLYSFFAYWGLALAGIPFMPYALSSPKTSDIQGRQA